MWQLQLECEPFGSQTLTSDGCFGRTASDGKVIARQNDRATVDLGTAEQEIGGCKRNQLAVGVILGDPGDGADLMKGIWIADCADALADGELVELMLASDLLGAAHLKRELLPLAQLA